MKFFAPLKNTSVWQSPSVIVLVLANLIPLAGVLLFGWAVFPIMLLFWLENVVVGVINVFKMLLAGGGAPAQIVKVFLIPFFCVHYGMFTGIHGVFVFALFGPKDGAKMHAGPFPSLDLIRNNISEQHLGWAVIALVASHLFSFGWNYLRRGEYRKTTAQVLMVQPYGRVVVLHFAIIGGGFLILALGSPTAALPLLVLLKIGLDVRAHAKEHALVPRHNELINASENPSQSR